MERKDKKEELKEALRNKCSIAANEVIAAIDKLEKTEKIMDGILTAITFFFCYQYIVDDRIGLAVIMSIVSAVFSAIISIISDKLANDLYKEFSKEDNKNEDWYNQI